MRRVLLLAIIFFIIRSGAAQQLNIVDTTTANAVLKRNEKVFPKFCRELSYIRAHDELIKQVNFSRSKILNGSPASASPKGVINIDISFLETPKPNFDDNRLIVVLYYEIGHLHYFTTTPRADWTSMNSEKAAFEYSLLKTKELAEKGDCLPLQTGLKFMQLRSEGTNLQDPHVRALKLMVTEPLYFDYLKYVKEHCE